MSDIAAESKSGANGDARKVRLRSAEGDSYELPYESSLISILVKNTIEVEDSDYDDDDNNDQETDMYEIDIPKVSSNTLAHVVKFMRHYVEEQAMEPLTTPLNGNDIATIFASQPWYRDYIENMDRSMVFKIVQAANFMEIQPLLDIACLRVSTELVGKSAEEIRIILNLPKMTDEEHEEARKKHPWIFETD